MEHSEKEQQVRKGIRRGVTSLHGWPVGCRRCSRSVCCRPTRVGLGQLGGLIRIGDTSGADLRERGLLCLVPDNRPRHIRRQRGSNEDLGDLQAR